MKKFAVRVANLTVRLAKFVNNFGFVKGTELFLKMRLGTVAKVKLPGVPHPVFLRTNTSDFSAFLQVFADNEYKINFQKPAVVFDCGANIGMFGVYMKSRFPQTQLVCVEPDPENFAVLKKNLSAYDRVAFENCGIWNKDSKLKVYDKFNLGKWGMVVEEDLANGTVPAVSINTLMEKYGVETIDVLKIDIETSERQLFADHYQDWLPKVKTIIIEFHDWLLEGCSKTFFEAVNNSFSSYVFEMKGENVIIINRDLVG